MALPFALLSQVNVTQVSFKPVADSGLLVVFADALSDAAHEAVLALDRTLSADMPNGVTELVPALVNLMVIFDPIQTDHVAVQRAVEERLGNLLHKSAAAESHTVDVCYETPFAPDLDSAAQATGLSQEAVINAHLGGDYRVLMFGFAPGYGYLGGVADAIQVPRKTAAVPNVPAGSVMIAGPQCLITTLKMPTGWTVIGRSPTPVLTQNETAPILFKVGDNVRFNRISAAEYDRLARGGTQ